MNSLRIYLLIAVLLILLILYAVRGLLSGLLKDQSDASDIKPFSLSRTLFCFWTVLVLFAICYIGIAEDQLPAIGTSTLLLMGIASGTTLTGRAIDNLQAADKNLIRIQDNNSISFWKDLLTDKNGVSIARFQTVCFNLVYAAVFLGTVISDKKLYEFTGTAMTLLGISSGAYAMLKIPEATTK